MSDMPWAKAILQVLTQAGPEGMHYTEIAREVQDQGLRTSVGSTPPATVASNLSKRLQARVERVSAGVYRLQQQSPQVTSAAASLDATAAGEDSDEAVDLADVAEVADEDTDETGLINAFGMFWERSKVNWSQTKPTILGQSQAGGAGVDFSAQQGVYILYDGSRVIYVGRAAPGALGDRLRHHTRDRLRTRWDRFSWFGVRAVRQDGQLAPARESGIDLETLVATMEALLIEGLEPPQNRRGGDGFAAIEFVQLEDETVRSKRQIEDLVRLIAK